MSSATGLRVHVNSGVFISILLLILSITALHAAEPGNLVLETGRGGILDTFSLETDAEGATEEESHTKAVADLQGLLEREFRRRGYFTDEFPIIEILDTRHLVLSFGKTEGVEPGDEFLLLPPRGSDGSPGLMFIEEVSGEVSYGYVIYSPGKVSRETGVEKIERLGIDISVYGRPMIGLKDGDIPFSTAFGVRGFPVRRFPHVRPFLGLEFPVHSSIGEWPGVPVNGIVGLETCWNLGRFQIAPASGLGLGVLVPTEAGDELMAGHLGYSIEAVFSFLVHPDIRLFLSAGYTEWSCISRTPLGSSGADNYGGILLGTGLRIKL